MTARALRLLCALCAAALAWACGDAQSEFSPVRISFVFDNSLHHNTVLAGAMTPHSGLFCTVSQRLAPTGVEFVFTGMDGKSEASRANARDVRRAVILGQNNGLILGYGITIDPAVFYAYDQRCPNCRGTLTITPAAKAACPVCRREYDLNNGGIVAKGDGGLKLTRYRATTTGPYGALAVN